MTQRLQSIKQEVAEIVRTFSAKTHIEEIREGCQSVDITLSSPLDFEAQKELRNTIGILLDKDPSLIKIIA